MFLINLKLAPSSLHGIGVFTEEDIAEGVVMYRHNPTLDLQLTAAQFAELDEREQRVILHYGYIDRLTGLYRLDHDDIRFVNDSYTPNVRQDEESGYLIALRPIRAGEEITLSYSDFEDRRFATPLA